MKRKKKGQSNVSGGSAAGVVGLILVVIVIYIILLPPAERNELLGDEDENGNPISSSEYENVTLLLEDPGTLSYIGQDDVEKTIPNVYLYKDTNSKVIENFNNFYIRNGWFDKIKRNITFDVDDLENTDNVMLSFSTTKNKGILTVKLNGKIVYEYDIDTLNVNPIELRKSSLKDTNILELSVSSVGWKLWRTNEYSFEDVKVVGDITDTTMQKSKNVFTLTESEYQNLDDAILKFIPYCANEKEVSVLDVLINNRNVYSTVPVCDDPVRQAFSISILNAGENNVVFKSTRGTYSIEQIRLDMDLKETKKIVYYFELNETQFEDVTSDDMNVNIYIDFVEDDEEKKLDLSINGHLTSIRQDEFDYRKDISHWVEEGNNYLELRPMTTLYIPRLEVKFED